MTQKNDRVQKWLKKMIAYKNDRVQKFFKFLIKNDRVQI